MVVQHLGYGSIQCIVMYMEANKRFEISQRIPSLQNLERVVPLSIDTLDFKSYEVEMNNVSYSLGIIQKSSDGPLPDFLESINSDGGDQCDLDQFGFEDYTYDDIITPGDISIVDPDLNDPRIIPRNEQHFAMLENNLKNNEKLMREAEEGSNEQNLYKESVDTYRRQLMPYYYQRENTPSPYERFIQLTITKYNESGEETKKEVINYTKKLGEAFKYLTTSLFGNRKFVVNVRILLTDSTPIVLRLPENLKLNVKNLNVDSNAGLALNALSPILQNSLFDELSVYFIEEEDLLREEVRNAKSLVIQEIGTNPNWNTFIRTLQNPIVHFGYDIPPEDYISLINYWVEVGKPSGTCYTFYLDIDEPTEELKEVLEIVDQSKIRVTIVDDSIGEMDELTWTVKFEVI